MHRKVFWATLYIHHTRHELQSVHQKWGAHARHELENLGWTTFSTTDSTDAVYDAERILSAVCKPTWITHNPMHRQNLEDLSYQGSVLHLWETSFVLHREECFFLQIQNANRAAMQVVQSEQIRQQRATTFTAYYIAGKADQ